MVFTIKHLRTERKLTQKQLAAELGITERNYQHDEAGTKKPSFEGLIKSADYFDISADYLLGRENHQLNPDENH